MKKIGLFGGTFDPVHQAHLALARMARDSLELDVLYWIPSKPWQKSHRQITDGTYRSQMIEQVLQGEKRMILDRCELERQGDSYTIDTIAEFKNRFPAARLFLLIGADQWSNFHTWKDWQDILEQTQIVVVTRNGSFEPCDDIVCEFMENYELKIKILDLPPSNISSQEIRSIIAKDGALSDKLVEKLHREVIRFIHTLGLYQQ